MRKAFLFLSIIALSIGILGCSQPDLTTDDVIYLTPLEDEENSALSPSPLPLEESVEPEALNTNRFDKSIQANGYSYSIDSNWETRPLKEGANASYYLLEGTFEDPLVSLLVLESTPAQECAAAGEQIEYLKSMIPSTSADEASISESNIGSYGCIEYQVKTNNQVQYLASFFVDPNYFVKIVVAGEAESILAHESLAKEVLATVVLSEFDDSLIDS